MPTALAGQVNWPNIDWFIELCPGNRKENIWAYYWYKEKLKEITKPVKPAYISDRLKPFDTEFTDGGRVV